jgi:hypothetical protein
MGDSQLNKIVLKIENLMTNKSFLKIKESDGVLTRLEYYDGENLCGKLSLTIYPGERKYELKVSSIRYYSLEKKCKLSGTEILKWIKKIKEEKLVKRIFLEDASQFRFPGSKIDIKLTRFRKFVFGQGWYESYGFISFDNNNFYQKSFLNFQRNSINNLCVLIYYILKDILKLNSSKDFIINKFASKYKVSDEVVNQTTNNLNYTVNNLFYKYNGDKHTSTSQTITIIDLVYNNNLFNDFIDIIYKFGVFIPNESGDLYSIVGTSKPNNTCILKSLTPPSTRKIIDSTLKFKDSAADTIKYIETLESILDISELLGILYVPTNLHLPGKGTTYKKTMQRCTKSYKKYSK